jgi:predicted glycoside hydrolase/deacetylase ChbG (UPF0249 family)
MSASRVDVPIRWLIVNADDFGASPAINRGVIEGHEKGIITSTSLMACREAAEEAAVIARAHPTLAVGIHIDLGEWVYRDGSWQANYERVDADDAAAVQQEITRQLCVFRNLIGREPTHIDSHQHVHNHQPVRGITEEVAHRLNVPLRAGPGGVTFCGDFYGQDGIGTHHHRLISVQHLMELIDGLAPGITEIMCHPSAGPVPDSVYSTERMMELSALCDPSVRVAIDLAGVQLGSFADVAQLR